MGKNKKGRFRAGLAAAALLALIGGVYAYLTANDSKTNEFTVGNNQVEIDEDFEPPTGLKGGVNAYKKSVKVENTGNVPCYVRVYVAFSDGEVEDWSGLSSDGKTYYSASPDGLSEDISLKDLDTGEVTGTIHQEAYCKNLPTDGNWVYLPEASDTADTVASAMGGWYYYTQPVAAGSSTTALFDQVLTYFSSADLVQEYQIYVYAESVQVRDHNGDTVTAQTGEEAWKNAWKEFLERSRTGG